MAKHGAVSSVLLRMSGSWPLSAAAREFASAGVPVFPCVAYGKRPATGHGFHDATTDLAQVEAWWRQSPGANIGVPTGTASGAVVVDVDVHGPVDGRASFDRAARAGLVDGWELLVRTPTGGLHAYYPTTPDAEQRSWQAGRAGIDFRGDGGYIIVPPSLRSIQGATVSYGVETINTGRTGLLDSDALRDFLDPRPSSRTSPTVRDLAAGGPGGCAAVGGVAGPAGDRPQLEAVLGVLPSRRGRRPAHRCPRRCAVGSEVGLRATRDHRHGPLRLPHRPRRISPTRLIIVAGARGVAASCGRLVPPRRQHRTGDIEGARAVMTAPITSSTAANRATGRRWAVVTAVSGTVFIAAGAFWLSFTALADLAARSGVGAGQAWAWPLIVDGIIVVATVAVVALAGQKAAWYPWALLIGGAAVSVTANAIHAVVAADADVPGVLAASVAAVPPVVLLAITHLTVILTRPTPSTASADDADAALAAPDPAVLDALGRSSPHELTAPRDADESAHAARPSATGAPATAALNRRDRAAELRRVGWSNKRIARELGVHPSTVGRWFAGAHLPDSNDGEEATR